MDPAVLALALIPLGGDDPAPSLTRSRRYSENLVCERITVEAARERRIGSVAEPKPRGDFVERSVLLCSERWIRRGLREDRDEAILSDLDVRAREVALAAASARPDLAGHTWMVDTFYPSAQVSTKVSFATKNALMHSGLAVSDRVPFLGAGDVDVLTRMHPSEAYPGACLRYHQSGSLEDGEVLLALVSRDRRDTALHAGLCESGRWTWLR